MVSASFPNRPFDLRDEVWLIEQDISNNRSKVGWRLWIDKRSYSPTQSSGAAQRWMKLDGGFVHESYGNGFNFVNGNNFLLGQGEAWIGHNADGTKTFQIEAAATFDILGSTSLSTPFNLPTIPRASTPRFSGGNWMYLNQSIDVFTDRASNTFSHDLQFFLNGYAQTVATGILDGYSYSPGIALSSYMTNVTQAVGTLRLVTFQGSTMIGYKDIALGVIVPESVLPVITGAVTATEATAGVASNVGKLVQGVSTLNVAMGANDGAYGSTIQSRKIEILKGTTVLQTINGASGTSAPLNDSGTLTVKATVTDSRGRSASKSITVDVLPWAPPVLNAVTVQRALSTGVANEDGTYLRVNINAAVSSLLNSTQRNALGYRISTRVRNTTSWTLKSNPAASGLTFNNYVLISSYPVDVAYDVLIEVYDDFATSAVIITAATSRIFMHWGNQSAGQGVGVNKFWERGALDVGGDIYANSGLIDPVGSIIMYGGSTAPLGWLICDGSAVSRTTYAALFAVIGTTWGAGNGSSTFNLPNFKGRTPVGFDSAQTEFNALGKTGGTKTETLTIAQMPTGVPVLQAGATGYYWNGNTGQSDRANPGGGQAHNNLQPYGTVNMLIRAV